MANDYREKIRKLLALAQSPNEHEARSALLKAKELMAEHKLTEAELEDVKSKNVKQMLTGVTYSKRRDPWILKLSSVIGENYCCQAYSNKEYDMQTREVGFVGLEDDIELCMEIFKYAVDCIHSQQKQIRKEYKNADYRVRNSALDGYGDGFATGIKRAFEAQKQKKEEGWGLVMAMPQEVKDHCSGFKSEAFRAAALANMSGSARRRGIEDGKQFDPGSKIKGRSEEMACLA